MKSSFVTLSFKRNRYLNACNTFRELLAMGVVPIVNENDTVSVSEIRFGDNGMSRQFLLFQMQLSLHTRHKDTLSAITAAMVNAEALFLLTDVDSLYTANPRRDPNATPIPRVENLDTLATQASFEGSGSSMGTGGMSTKIAAARLATTAGVHCVVKSSETPGAIIEIIEELGRHDEDCDSARTSRYTHFVAQPRPASQRRVRKWWIAHGMVPRGRIHVDDGAYRALLHFDMASVSLFAVGVTCVEGDFQAQDCVSVVHEKDGVMVEVARGLVNYSSTEMKRICGIRSEEIPRVLGCVDAESVIHRYNLVVLGQGVSAPAAVAESM